MTGVVFDLDGTLIDSVSAVCDVANALMDELDLPRLDLDEARGYIGHGAERFLQQALQARGSLHDGPSYPRKLERFMELYSEAPGEANKPFPGVDAALRQLLERGFALGLCTNKPLAPTRVVLDAMGWGDLFEVVIAGGMLAEKKPHPAPLLEASRRLGRQHVVYVGDSEVDAETASAAEMPFLLFADGYRKSPIEELAHSAVFSDFLQLPALVVSVAGSDQVRRDTSAHSPPASSK